MPKYVIEREMPGVGKLSGPEIKAASRRSNEAIAKVGPRIQWLHSYVTGDKLYCVYIAADEEAIREHARLGNFPANRICRIQEMIDPTTGE
ncbi:MAG: DUF4242 domain-containing protein [Thermoanaerobaculia bacterium]